MKKFRAFLPYIEAAIAYGLLFFYALDFFSIEIRPYIFIFVGIIFALFYGVQGMIIAIIGFLFALGQMHDFILNPITLEDWLIAIIGTLLFVIVGSRTTTITKDLNIQLEANKMSQTRIQELFSQLASIDKSHKKFLSDSHFRVDRPSYLYHELGKLSEHFNDEMQLFAKLFSLLYRHQFVEGGVVYKLQEYQDLEYDSNYLAMFRYGLSVFPKTIELNDPPQWFKLLEAEKEIISPKIIDKKFIISIPVVLKPSNKMQYIIVIERIRQTQITPETSHSLNITAIIIKFILEEQFYLAKNRENYSLFKNVMVFRPGVAERFLKERLELFTNANLPYKLTYWKLDELPEDLEKVATRVHSASRHFDEQFVIGDKLFILFTFSEVFTPIQTRFKRYYSTIELKEVTNVNLKQLNSNDDFLSLGS
jgi:hypothetical protein